MKEIERIVAEQVASAMAEQVGAPLESLEAKLDAAIHRIEEVAKAMADVAGLLPALRHALAPIVLGVDPARAFPGSAVAISGWNFAPGCLAEVRFGTTPAKASWISQGEIIAEVPPRLAPGKCAIQVQTSFGTSEYRARFGVLGQSCVHLVAVGPDPQRVRKEVRAATGLGLQEVMNLIHDGAVIGCFPAPMDADKLADSLRLAGATVDVRAEC